MPYYHALFRNMKTNKASEETGYWTAGGEYNGLFNEEFARDAIQPGVEAELVVVHFFASETELMLFHQQGSWRDYMK